jgi:phage-related protein
MPTYDGSININTKIDAKGVNQGTKDIGKAVEKNIAKPTQSLTKSMSGILSMVKLIGKALIAAFVGGQIIGAIRNIVQEFDLLTGTSGDKFKQLSGALETLKGAFVNLMVQAFVPMIPTIIEVVNWLTTLFQTVTQIVAALFGFESTVGGIMTKAASGAQKAAKSAKGALAAFDQINVLQKPTDPESPTGATATPGPLTISPEAQETANGILDTIGEIKDIWNNVEEGNFSGAWDKFLDFVYWEEWKKFFKGLWAEIGKWFEGTSIGEWIKALRENFINSWRAIIANTIEMLQKIKENVLRAFNGIKEFVIGVFTGDWQRAWEGLKEIAAGIFGALEAWVEGTLENISILIEGIGNGIQILLGPLIDWVAEKLSGVAGSMVEISQKIKDTWGKLTTWFMENVWNPLANGFGSMLTDVRQGFEKTFTGIKGFIKGVINNIIDFINGMIEGIVFGINTLIGGANAVGELVGIPEIGYIDAPKIPKLATGAVIPPNSEFLAVLGDQRGGRNIEAPESLIRQIVREETGKMQADISIRFEGSLASLVRELKPVIDRENIRVGASLVKGAVRL